MYIYVGLFITTHFLYNAIEYMYHKLGHYNHKYNYIHNLHMIHHKKHYPVTMLQSDTYRHNYEGVVAYTPPTMVLMYVFYKIIPYHYLMLIITQIGVNVCINDYIHTRVHLKSTWLDKYDWFLEIRRLHLTHHKKLYSNYSFGYDYTIDKLSNTYLTE